MVVALAQGGTVSRLKTSPAQEWRHSTVVTRQERFSATPTCSIIRELYCTVLYCTALYCTVLYCTVLYCTDPRHVPDGEALPLGGGVDDGVTRGGHRQHEGVASSQGDACGNRWDKN